jgi:phenylacetate-CoA ligase
MSLIPWIQRSITELSQNVKLSRDEFRKYLLLKLRSTVKYVYERSLFYRELYRKHNVNLDRVRSFKDFSKLPFTLPSHIAENPYRFLCVSQSEILRGFTVEDINGEVRRIFFTEDELIHIVESVMFGLKMANFRENDTVQISVPKEAEWGIHQILKMAVEMGGGRGVLVDELQFPIQLQSLRSLKPQILIGPTPHIFYFSEWCEEKFPSILKSLKLKSVIMCHGCIFYPFTELMKKELRDIWGCDVFDHYGITEMGFTVAMECPIHEGMHINEVDVYAEVIDPKTGELLEPEEEGELVLTSINRRGMPIVRYRTGDITKLIDEPCKCGDIVTRRLASIKYRIKSYSGG